MKIPEWSSEDQSCRLGRHIWSVSRLRELARDLPVMDVPLDHLYIYHKYDGLTLRDMVMHMEAVQNVDMDCPIIMDEDGDIMDGRHRIMRALLDRRDTIRAVRFDSNPAPCRVEET